MLRYLWTVQGDDHDFAAGDRHGIGGYFLPMFDQPLTSKAALQEVRNRGHAAGLYLGAGWLSIDDPKALVDKVDAEYKRCFVPGLKVQFNLEEHEPAKIAAVLEEWRSRPGRANVGTSWTCEPMQGGWMSPSFVSRMLACRVRFVPQTFGNRMQRYAEDAVLRDLLKRGIPDSGISLFYDAAALPINWDGYAFTAGRLP